MRDRLVEAVLEDMQRTGYHIGGNDNAELVFARIAVDAVLAKLREGAVGRVLSACLRLHSAIVRGD